MSGKLRLAEPWLAATMGIVALMAGLILVPPRAVGTTPDSVQYHSAARRLLDDGKMLTTNHNDWEHPDSVVAMKHYPPGVSLALAAGLAVDADYRVATQWLNAMSAATWMFGLIWLLARRVGRVAAIVIGTAIALTPDVVYVHQYLMSEPLYLATVMVTVMLMVEKPDRPLAYGAGAALASMVRYIGLAAILAACSWALLQPGSPRRRLARAVMAGLPSLILQGWWQIRIMLSGQRIAPLQAPGEWSAEAYRAAGVVSWWLVPGVENDAMRAVIAVLVIAGTIGLVVWRRRDIRMALEPSRAVRPVLAAVGLMLGWFIVVLLALRSSTYIIPFDNRILAPAEFLATIAAGTLLVLVWRESSRPTRWWMAAAAVAWAVMALGADLRLAADARSHGLDYGRRERVDAESVQWIRQNGKPFAFFTNAHATLYFNAGRHARALPLDWTAAERERFADTVRARNGLIAVFSYPSGKVPAAERLVAELPVTVVRRFPDAVIYRVDRVNDSAARPR